MTIRSSVHDVEVALIISVILVVFVVFAFLRNVWATIIPSVAVPLSSVGTFGVMYLCHYSLDNLSLMALTICTGFVVDDAIVVIENITRHIESGMAPLRGHHEGLAGDWFHGDFHERVAGGRVYSDLDDGRHCGRGCFREFAVVLSVAIGVSLFDFADHHADDVRAFLAARHRKAQPAFIDFRNEPSTALLHVTIFRCSGSCATSS